MFLDFLLLSSIVLGLVFYLTTCLLKGVSSKEVYHGTVIIYDTKQYRVLLELHITQRQLESPEKTKRSSVDSYGQKHCQVTALPHVRNALC